MRTVDSFGELMQYQPRYIERGDIAYAKIVIVEPVFLEAFNTCEELGKFALLVKEEIVAVGLIQRKTSKY